MESEDNAIEEYSSSVSATAILPEHITDREEERPSNERDY